MIKMKLRTVDMVFIALCVDSSVFSDFFPDFTRRRTAYAANFGGYLLRIFFGAEKLAGSGSIYFAGICGRAGVCGISRWRWRHSWPYRRIFVGLFINGVLLWSWYKKENLGGAAAGGGGNPAMPCFGGFTV